MLNLISGVIQLIFLILSKWGEKDAENKKKKEATQKELANALNNMDASAINLAIQHAKRLR